MTDTDLEKATLQAIQQIKNHFGSIKFKQSPTGAFCAGRRSDAPGEENWLAASVFRPLTDSQIDKLQSYLPYPSPEQTSAYIPQQFRIFLKICNGLRIFNLSIYGDYSIRDPLIGSPIGLNTAAYLPPKVPRTSFGFGSINGEYYSQGHLSLTLYGQVELRHSDTGERGKIWATLAEFLDDEVPRQLQTRDLDGTRIAGISCLPGNVDTWEETAKKVAEKRHFDASIPGKLNLWIKAKLDR